MTVLPEIPESEADPELRVLYEEIRSTAGTAMVNLVYRHIATIPDALPWVWTTVKSGIGYETIHAASGRLRVTGFGRPLPASAFRLLSLTEQDLSTATRIVAAYNSANALNIVIIAALRRIVDVIEDGAAPVGASIASAPEQAPAPHAQEPLPPIIPFSGLTPETSDLVRRLSAIGNVSSAHDGITPSLYRHLAHWPSYLALALAVLDPLDDSGALEGARRRSVTSATDLGLPLAEAAMARGVPALPAHARVELLAALDVFLERVIAKMLPIGHTLIALTPPEARPR